MCQNLALLYTNSHYGVKPILYTSYKFKTVILVMFLYKNIHFSLFNETPKEASAYLRKVVSQNKCVRRKHLVPKNNPNTRISEHCFLYIC